MISKVISGIVLMVVSGAAWGQGIDSVSLDLKRLSGLEFEKICRSLLLEKQVYFVSTKML